MEYYKAHNFLSGRPTSARYEVAAVMISIILCQNETKKAITLLSDNTYSLEPIDRPEILSKYSSDISQAQNKLWKNIDSLMTVCTMRDIVWEAKHFKSKTSSLNKLVDSLAKGIESKITKAVDDVKQNWPDFNIVEKELSPAHKRYFTGSDV
uniref:RNase H domain-containing protein n=1 Tax=Strongyloides papillosus TaxID=174720 RepID=A0A0N5C1P0_STREA